MDLTFIELFGVKIAEPVTSFTDLIVSCVCFNAFVKIHNRNSNQPVHSLFKYYFLVMAVATFYGGIIGHAFLYALSFEWKVPGWIISMISIMLIERAAIVHARPLMKKWAGDLFSVINIIELLTLITIVLYTQNFFFVETHAFYGLMIVVFSFELYVYLKTKDKGSRQLLFAVGISALAAAVHLSKLSLHKWFNYLDLSHVLMATAAYVFYLGVKDIRTENKFISS